VTVNTAVRAIRQERDVRSNGPRAIRGAEIFAHGAVVQPDGMAPAQRRRQIPRRRPGYDRNVAPKTVSLHGDDAATGRCGRRRSLRYAFPRGPRVASPEAGTGPRPVGSAGLRVKTIARAGFFSRVSLLALALVLAWAAPASDRRQGSAWLTRALERGRARGRRP
jgi:hypothetical protein